MSSVPSDARPFFAAPTSAINRRSRRWLTASSRSSAGSTWSSSPPCSASGEFFYKADMAGFRKTIDVSMWGAFFVLRAAAIQMIKHGQGGSVVVVSSPQAHVAMPSCMAYNMAKAAEDQMARTAALELTPHRIRVNVVYPGWTDTSGERKFFTEDVLQRAAAALPMGRLAQPEEIARGILFLLDPGSEYITGTTLSIDGGATAVVVETWDRRLLSRVRCRGSEGVDRLCSAPAASALPSARRGSPLARRGSPRASARVSSRSRGSPRAGARSPRARRGSPDPAARSARVS